MPQDRRPPLPPPRLPGAHCCARVSGFNKHVQRDETPTHDLPINLPISIFFYHFNFRQEQEMQIVAQKSLQKGCLHSRHMLSPRSLSWGSLRTKQQKHHNWELKVTVTCFPLSLFHSVLPGDDKVCSDEPRFKRGAHSHEQRPGRTRGLLEDATFSTDQGQACSHTPPESTYLLDGSPVLPAYQQEIRRP